MLRTHLVRTAKEARGANQFPGTKDPRVTWASRDQKKPRATSPPWNHLQPLVNHHEPYGVLQSGD